MTADLLLEIPSKIVEVVDGFKTELGSDQIEVLEAFHHDDDVPADLVRVLVYPLTKTTSGNKIQDVDPTYFVSIRRKCRPDQTDRLKESIKYRLDLEDLLAATKLPTSHPVSYQQSEAESMLWFPDLLNVENQYAAIFEVKYSWSQRPASPQGS